MIPRNNLSRAATQLALRQAGCARLAQGRGFASAASSGAFEGADAAGVRIASRESHAPTTKLAVVAKAGTRYQPLPGLTAGLESFAFKVREPMAPPSCFETRPY